MLATLILAMVLCLAAVPLLAARRGSGTRAWRALLPKRLRNRILIGCLLVAILPCAAATVYLTRYYADLGSEANKLHLRQFADTAAREISHAIRHYQDGVQNAAAGMAGDSGVTVEEAIATLTQLHDQYPGFLTMLVADARGAVLAATRLTAGHAQSARGRGGLVSDRDFFREPMRTGKLYVSDVARGRGLGIDLVATVSAPVVRAGRAVGIVQGTLDLGLLQRMQNASRSVESPSDGIGVLILDNRGRVIDSGEYADLPLLADVGVVVRSLADATHRVPATAVRWRGTGNDRHLIGAARTIDNGWQVAALAPDTDWLEGMVDNLAPSVGILAAAILGALALSLAVNGSIARPLAALSQAVRVFRADGPRGQLTTVASDCVEFIQLQRQLNRLAWRERAQQRELHKYLRHSRLLRDQLARTVAQREREIYNRTQELARANAELQRMSTTDALTEVPNRRGFDQEFDRAWRSAQRDGKSVALLMADADHFKLYNDSHGHLAGDECLKRMAKALRSSLLRPTDFLARYGGEEFAVILPNTDSDGARLVAERLRAAVESLGIPGANANNPVTISIGYTAIVPSTQCSTESLLIAADIALYMAKQQGRNRICGQLVPDANELAQVEASTRRA